MSRNNLNNSIKELKKDKEFMQGLAIRELFDKYVEDLTEKSNDIVFEFINRKNTKKSNHEYYQNLEKLWIKAFSKIPNMNVATNIIEAYLFNETQYDNENKRPDLYTKYGLPNNEFSPISQTRKDLDDFQRYLQLKIDQCKQFIEKEIKYISFLLKDKRAHYLLQLGYIDEALELIKEIEEVDIKGFPSYAKWNPRIRALKHKAQTILPPNPEIGKLRKQYKNCFQIIKKDESVEWIGESDELHKIMESALNRAHDNNPVLITGESGSGKEFVAHAIHNIQNFNKNRKKPTGDTKNSSNKKMVIQNCAVLSEELARSELFGHEKGTFTGAISDKIGLLEKADNNTLFLDEFHTLKIDIQVSLLRFIESGEIHKITNNNGYDSKRVNTRLIFATTYSKDDLCNNVSNTPFASDLINRLNPYNAIEIPPLRERGFDSVLISDHIAQKTEKPLSLTPYALATVASVDSENKNIREIMNILETIRSNSQNEQIDEHDVYRVNPNIKENNIPRPETVLACMALKDQKQNPGQPRPGRPKHLAPEEETNRISALEEAHGDINKAISIYFQNNPQSSSKKAAIRQYLKRYKNE